MHKNRTLTVAELIDRSDFGPIQLRVWLLCGLVLLIDGYDLATMGFAAPAIARGLGIPVQEFGMVMSASFVGVALGSLLAGPAGDKLGRRPSIIACFTIVSVATLLTAGCRNLPEFAICRFLTGIGMGGVVPNAVALISEYMPLRRRSLLVVSAFSSAALGSSGGSVLATVIVPRWGWESIFIVGGMLTLAQVLLVTLFLPESLHVLIRRKRTDRANEICRQIEAGVRVELRATSSTSRGKISELFNATWLPITLGLWTLFICTQASVFFMTNWLSVILIKGGVPETTALYALSAFHLGSFLCGLLAGWWSDRKAAEPPVIAAYILAILALLLLAAAGDARLAVIPICFLLGGGTVGASFSLGGLASSYYPPSIRATGFGWGLSVGRLGSITSPMIGAYMIARDWPTATILEAAILPAAICVIVLIFIIRVRARHAVG